MVQDREFPVPPEVDEILDRLPPQVTLNVPDYVLLRWFPPEAADGSVDEVTLERAKLCAELRLQVCVSRHHPRGRVLSAAAAREVSARSRTATFHRNHTRLLLMRALSMSMATTVTTTMITCAAVSA